MIQGTKHFRRFVKDCRKISPHLRIKPIKHGFCRIYWKHAYLGECFKEMPALGYDHTDNDPNYESKKFYESKEDRAELTRKLKNFVEGYWDSISKMRTRVWMLRHDKEFNEVTSKGYQQLVVK